MYRRVIKPVLFSLTIEQAHHAVLLLLRIIGLIPGGRWLLRKCYAVEHPALEREVFGIRFANPIGLAAGFDHNGEAFRELAALGLPRAMLSERPLALHASYSFFAAA